MAKQVESQTEAPRNPLYRALQSVLPGDTAARVWTGLPQYTVIIGFVVLCIILAAASPVFLTGRNLLNVALQASVTAVLAFGVTFVILTAGIDLSVGSVAAFTGALIAGVAGVNPILGVLAGLVAGLILGSVNGVFVAYLRVAPFIATLAMLAIARGLTYIFTQGAPIDVKSEGLNSVGQGSFGPIPVPVVITVVIFGLCYVALKQTRFGRYTYAIGSNPEVVRFSGIKISRYVVAVYALSGLLAAVGGLILATRLGTADPTAATGYELDAIAAVVIGGTSLFGGRGSLALTLVGALIIAVVDNGLVLLNVNPFWAQAVKGVIILIAVLPDSLRRRSWYSS